MKFSNCINYAKHVSKSHFAKRVYTTTLPLQFSLIEENDRNVVRRFIGEYNRLMITIMNMLANDLKVWVKLFSYVIGSESMYNFV